MHQFEEHHSEFEGFSAFYDREIRPGLEVVEDKRIAAISKAKRVIGIMAAVIAIFVVILVWRDIDILIVAFVLIFGAILTFIVGVYQTRHVEAETKQLIMGNISRFLNLDYSQKLTSSPNLRRFTTLGLLPGGADRESFEDQISGQAHGANFLIHEAHLERKVQRDKRTSWETIFRGQVMMIDFNRNFLGRTVVLRDKGLFNRKARGDMKRVGLVDPVFEKIFEAYGTDQVEARYILTPTFMQRLVDLEDSVDGSHIRFGFEGGQLLIAVETRNRYEAGSMFEPLTETSRTQKILDEIGAIFDVIDGVLKRQD